MGLAAEIQGRAQLRRLAENIKATGDKGLGREMSAALRKVTVPVQKSIRTEAEQAMPTRGGYRETLTKSLKFRVGQRSSARKATLTLTTYATGSSERRDVRTLDKGRLRHPVFGRSRTVRGRGRVPNPWAVTTIRSGFHTRGTDNAADAAARELGRVMDDFAARLLKG